MATARDAIARVRTQVEQALAEDLRTGALRARLLAIHGTGQGAQEAADQAVEQVRGCLAAAVQRLEATAAAPATPAQARRISDLVLALGAYCELDADVLPDAGQGAWGLLDDALLVHLLLDRLSDWYAGETGEELLPGLQWEGATELHALLSPQDNETLARVADAMWFGEDFVPRLAAPALAAGAPGDTAEPVWRKAPEEPADEVAPGARLYDVWFATTRAPLDRREPARGFSGELDPEGIVHYGTCSVQIPRTHKFGSTGTAWWSRWLRLEFEDDHITVRRRSLFASADECFADLREELAGLDDGARQVLFYLHGYNVSFDEAAIRAAQLFADLKAAGAAAFFSWPSLGSVEHYFADADRISASEAAIAGFLSRLATDLQGAKVHIIAHSMGNRGLARAIQRITAAASREAGVRFGQIILAAPDMEVTLFKDLARVYADVAERTTMYVSARDRALGLSKFLQDSARAGFTPPVTIVPGIDTIEVTDVDVTALGHGYYAEAEAVLYDIADVLKNGATAIPQTRVRLRAGDASRAGGPYWVIGA